MKDPSSRMLELLSLLQTGRTWPAVELASRLSTSLRTLRRDLDRLRVLGYPVAAARGPGGGYQLVAGRAVPPLLLTDDEAVALVVGLRSAALTPLDAAADSAMRKLERVLPARLRLRIQALGTSTEVVSRAARDLDPRIIQSLASAAHAHQDVRFDYTDRHGVHSERRAQPYRLVALGHRWYLFGWDRARADWRTYRIDRICSVTTPGTTFVPRELPDEAVSFVQSSFRRPTHPQRGVVRFAAPLATVADRLAAEVGTLEQLDDTSCRYVTDVESWEWLSVKLAAVGVPYVIEAPPELIACSKELAARITRGAGG